ncbi:MAG: hypothetical protein EOO65_00210 [Methanosarcinales archaeon]|nr:MAG: hypothetical protein EOO65_00210 [Methanosarcinales archaeon]
MNEMVCALVASKHIMQLSTTRVACSSNGIALQAGGSVQRTVRSRLACGGQRQLEEPHAAH